MAQPARRPVRSSRLPRIAVRVAHGDLAYARFPVVVGHYEHDAIVSAEAHLDKVWSGRLRERHAAGNYPGPADTASVFVDPDGRLPGALVIGLGEVGALTAASLGRAVEHGTSMWLQASHDDAGARSPRGLSLLLIGTGSGGIPVRDAVTALLRGVLRSALASAGTRGRPRVALGALDLLELYEDRAIQAARALQQASEDPELGPHLDVAARVVRTAGARRRASYREDDRWWRRLQILEGPHGSLVFNALTERARAEVRLHATRRAQVDEFLQRALRDSAADDSVAVTLNELLVPEDLREQSRDRRDLVLVLDEETARYPWELLRDRPDADRREKGRRSLPPAPPVTEAGVVRQLSTSTFREPVASTSALTALVIGDPPSDFPRLDGAVREAEAVRDRLRRHGYDVTTRIRARTDDVVATLFGGEYRILHLAGHGVYRYLPDTGLEPCRTCGSAGSCEHRQPVTGMVIGPGAYLTAAEIAGMQHVPQLVFLNCCHLGFIERSDRPTRRSGGAGARQARTPNHEWSPALWSSRSTIAANLAAEFIRMGVRVVIAAGWAVNDAAARLFATSVYEEMLEGRQPFGRAVTEARRRTYRRHPGVNTWGAYQCYGDPQFALVPAEPADNARPPRPMTAGELVTELEAVTLQAREPGADRVGLRRQLAGLMGGGPDAWLEQGDVREALAQACLALEEPARALEHFDRAMRLDRPSATIDAIGDFSVAQADRAAVLARAGRGRGKARALFEAGRARLEWLLSLGETPGRLARLASAARNGLALAETPVERVELLGEVRRYARRAHALARRQGRDADPGLMLDWVFAELALQLVRGRPRVPAALVARADRAHRLAAARFADTRHPSDALDVADALAARHLMQGDLSEAGPAIVRAYRKAGAAEGGGARGFSVSARLELLAEVLQPAGQPRS